MIDIEITKAWATLITLLISIATTAYVWISSGSKTVAKELEKFRELDAVEKKALMEAITALGHRAAAIESDMKHLPSQDSQHRLELAMSKISGELLALKEQLKPIDVLSRRLNEVLLEQAKK